MVGSFSGLCSFTQLLRALSDMSDTGCKKNGIERNTFVMHYGVVVELRLTFEHVPVTYIT